MLLEVDKFRGLDRGARARTKLQRGRVDERTGRFRRAEEKALHFLAALRAQERELLLGLDPFDGHVKLELARQHEHGPDDRGRSAMVGVHVR